MKKTIFTIAMCVSLLFTVSSCSNDDSVTDEIVPQNLQASSGVAYKFGTQTLSYNTSSLGIPLVKNFTSVSVNGNTTLQISVSNTGTVAANVMVYSSVSGGLISLPAIPAGSGAYSTYSYPISGWSGYAKVSVSPLSSGNVKGNIIVTSF